MISFLIISLSFIASPLLNKASYLPQSPNPDTLTVKRILSESFDLINAGNFIEGRIKADSAKMFSERISYNDGTLRSYLRIADVLINTQEYDSALIILNDALTLYDFQSVEPEIHNLMGVAYKYQNKYGPALESFTKALSMFDSVDSLKNARTITGIKLNMAGVYLDNGQTDLAFQSYVESIYFAVQSKDTLFLITALNNTGSAYNNDKKFERAAFYLEKAIKLAEEKILPDEILRSSLNLANSKADLSQFSESEALYNRALELHYQIRPNAPPIQILYNQGNLALKMENYSQAREKFLESLKASEERGIVPGVYYNSLGLGQVEQNQKNFDLSIPYFEKAKDAASIMNSLPFLNQALNYLYEVHKESDNDLLALQYLEESNKIKDSLSVIEKRRIASELESTLEIQRQVELNEALSRIQKEQEAQLRLQFMLLLAAAIVTILIIVFLFIYRNANKKISLINAELNQMNKGKDKIFAILAHDLRSPLAAIQGLLYLIKTDSIAKDQVEQLSADLEVSVQQNVDAMEDLLAWAREQLKEENMHIEMVDLYNIAIDVLRKKEYHFNKKGIKSRNLVRPKLLIKADKNALNLILRNLISNSIKFTKKDDAVSISSEEKESTVVILVKDNGVGISEKVKETLLSARKWSQDGTNKEKGSGFGLSLVNDFVKQMNGKIWFESEEGVGTTFFIELPKE